MNGTGVGAIVAKSRGRLEPREAAVQSHGPVATEERTS